MAGGFLELGGLFFELLEEAGVVDGEGGLVGEGLEEVNSGWRKLARLAAADDESRK